MYILTEKISGKRLFQNLQQQHHTCEAPRALTFAYLFVKEHDVLNSNFVFCFFFGFFFCDYKHSADKDGVLSLKRSLKIVVERVSTT